MMMSGTGYLDAQLPVAAPRRVHFLEYLESCQPAASSQHKIHLHFNIAAGKFIPIHLLLGEPSRYSIRDFIVFKHSIINQTLCFKTYMHFVLFHYHFCVNVDNWKHQTKILLLC